MVGVNNVVVAFVIVIAIAFVALPTYVLDRKRHQK